MELNVQDWKEFNIARLCYVDMGNKFDNDKMTYERPSINFVSRTANNNGVSDVVDEILGVTPYPANSVTVALGGSIGSCYLQTKPFYTGQNVSVLLFNANVPNNAKLFITTMFMNECKYKYVAFGRELNVHIRNDFTLYLPIKYNEDNTPVIDENKTYSDEGYIPDWQFMEDYIKSLHHKPITTKVKSGNIKKLDVDNWEEFKVQDLFELVHGKANDGMLEEGNDCVYLGAKLNDCGFMRKCKYNEKLAHEGNCICFVTNGEGSVGYAFYKGLEDKFIATIDLVMGYADFLTPAIGSFIATCLCLERRKYSHGRKWKKTLPTTVIKLPIQRDSNGNPVIVDNRTYSDNGYVPDWQYMEDYINSLPYSDRI